MKTILKILSEVIFDVFADMFFLFPEEVNDDVNGLVGPWHHVLVEISGYKPFKLHFFLGERTALQMAENYLGKDAAIVGEEMIEDVVKESVNVMAGNFLNKMNDQSILGIPIYLNKVNELKLFTRLSGLSFEIECATSCVFIEAIRQ